MCTVLFVGVLHNNGGVTLNQIVTKMKMKSDVVCLKFVKIFEP